MNKLKKLFSSRKRISILVILVSVLGFGGWRIFGGKEERPQFQTTPVERGMIISSVSASGQVLSVNIMSANTKASGIVSKVYVKDGDEVKKGDEILEIDLDFQGEQKRTQAWSSYLSAKNSLESAKTSQYTLQATMLDKWDAFKELAESDTYEDVNSPNRDLPEFHISEKEWLAAEAKYKNQEAVIAQAQVSINSSWLNYQLASPVITAPADGVVTSLMFVEGMSVGSLDTGSTTSNQKVATIRTEGVPIVSVNLSEIDVSRVEIGQKAIITLDSIPDKTFTGEVVGVDRIGQTTSGVTQYTAIIQLDSSSPEILPNMAATASIVIERKDDVLLVPSSVVQEQSGQSYARVLTDGKQQFVPVETGLVSDTQTEIISGLNEGDLVVTGTSSTALPGEVSPFGAPGFGGGIIRIRR
jgi:macrolide-specific efflux system membrane fusion protein